VQLQLHNQSSKTKWNICACLFACAVRHIPWSLYLAVLATQHVAQTLCSQKQHKNQDGSKQVQLQPGCTTIWHRCVCLFRWVGPIKQMLQAVPGCDGMCTNPVHTAVFRTACRQRLLTNSSCKTCWCTYVRMHACLRVLTRSNIPCRLYLAVLAVRTNPVQAVTTQQLAASSKHLHKNKTGCPAC
jgi:hypothetical protein